MTQGAHGAVVDNLDGTVTYTPTGSYAGPDSFTFTVTDGNSNTATGTIDVAVGLLPASPVSAILDDLSDIEDDLNNPDENTVAAVTGAFAAVAGAIDTYLNDATEFISAANVDAVGINLSVADFLTAVINAGGFLYPNLAFLEGIKLKLYDAMLANATAIEFLNDLQVAEARQPQPNKAKIVALELAIRQLIQLQQAAEPHLRAIDQQSRNAHTTYQKAYRAAVASYPTLLGWLPAPPEPVMLDYSQILPPD